MSSDENRRLKHQTMEEIEAVQEVLRRWDPIGVMPSLLESDLPSNEYDDYAPHIVWMLKAGCSVQQLFEHLNYCRTGAMGLGPDPSADQRVAAEIVGWWKRNAYGNDEGPSA